MATPTTLPATFVAGNVLTAAQMNDLRGAFRILQVISTTDTATFSASLAQNAETEYTALATTITPSATSSKILLIANVNLSNGPDNPGGTYCLRRGSTNIAIGDAAGSRAQVTTQSYMVLASAESPLATPAIFLDSPATTSATTYRIMLRQMRTGTNTVYANRSVNDPNGASTLFGARSVSTLTVMEISA